MKSKFSLLGLLLVALLTSFPAFSAVQLSATVSDNNVALGDLFILTVTINDNDKSYQLDTSPLKKSFTVYRPSQSKKTEYINGRFSQQTQWKVRLQAKETGLLTIPSLKIGDLQTKAIEIKVVQPSQKKQENTNDSIFIENSIDKKQIYIGQTFIFTTKLYLSQNSNSLELVAPRFEGLEAAVFGQDKNSQTVRNGIPYNTITRQYKMSATQAGQFEIDSPLLTGTLRKVIAVNEWRNRVISVPINIRGQRLTIDVKAIPENFQGEWLVSEDVRLIEDNNLTEKSYQVGEAITRSITLQIASVDKDKLPNIKLNYPQSLRVYPDQDQLAEGQANGLTYGTRTIRHAIIANKVGTLTLPEIKFNWFNSRTNQQETAILAAQELTIIAADKQAVNIPPTQQAEVKQPKATIIVDNSALIYWQIAVALLIIIIAFMIFYHLSYRRTVSHNNQSKKIKVTPLNHHYITLQNCLTKNNPGESYKALLAYAQQQYPALKTLHQFSASTALTQQQKQQLNDEINRLEQCCSGNMKTWNADKLALLIKQYELTKNKQSITDPLNLNP